MHKIKCRFKSFRSIYRVNMAYFWREFGLTGFYLPSLICWLLWRLDEFIFEVEVADKETEILTVMTQFSNIVVTYSKHVSALHLISRNVKSKILECGLFSGGPFSIHFSNNYFQQTSAFVIALSLKKASILNIINKDSHSSEIVCWNHHLLFSKTNLKMNSKSLRTYHWGNNLPLTCWANDSKYNNFKSIRQSPSTKYTWRPC